MACPDCPPNNGLPTSCGQVVVVQYQPPGSSSPIPAWLEYNCDGEEPQLIFYADAGLTSEIADASLNNIVGIGTGISGTSCSDSAKADLCPDTRDFIAGEFEDQTSELSSHITAQTTRVVNGISAQTTAINNNIDAEIQAQTAALLLAINREYDSLGAPLPVGFQGLPRTSTYTPGNLVETITVVSGASTYVRTFTYTGSNQTGDSGWVLQP